MYPNITISTGYFRKHATTFNLYQNSALVRTNLNYVSN